MGNIGLIIGAAVAHFIVGMLWYSPVLFGNQWMKASGITKKEIDKAKKKGMAIPMVIAAISALVMAFVLSKVMYMTGSKDPMSGVMIGFLAWVGFIATTSLNSVLWENKNMQYYTINNGYSLVSLLVMGAILGL